MIRGVYMKRKAFTLIELLAVIVILAVILAIAIPNISSLINVSKKTAFESTAKMIIKSIDTRKKSDLNFDINSVDVNTLKSNLEIDNRNYESIEATMISNDVYIAAIGKDIWSGLGVYGTKDNLVVVDLATGLFPASDSCFTFDTTTGTITDYLYTNTGCPSDVVIPSEIGGVAVKSLGYRSFYNNSLTSAVIPNTVTDIGNQAFYFNNLINVDIPDGVTFIGDRAFSYNQLVTIEIPASLSTINESVFSYNHTIENVILHDGLTTIGESAFESNQITSIEIPNSVTYIGDCAFGNNLLTNLTIPSSVTHIGYIAFYYNRLTNVTIPNSVTYIGGGAFNNNLLSDDKAMIYARKADGSSDTTPSTLDPP
jgi:prepilin-type N-terminal cleavage/methylation domain-containing protein